MLKISGTDKNSPAKKLKIKDGDILLEINGYPVSDILDYVFYDGGEELDVKIQSGGEIKTFNLEKDADEPFGLTFYENELTTGTCGNSCVFCFIDQLPPGLRDTLYVKDDDYRLSFVSGNYVTLTCLSPADIERIKRQRLSPLYVSVHTTDPELRRKITGNDGAGEIMDVLHDLAAAGIKIHCQIVLCEGLNDGAELEKTVNDLFLLYPYIMSLAVVPVGLTKHRRGLYPLKPLSQKSAAAAADFCEKFNRERGANFVFCSDELYVAADKDMPDFEYYGEFWQIENGVGLIRKFEKEFLDALEYFKPNKKSGAVSLATGRAAAEFMRYLAGEFNKKFPNIKVEVYPVRNDFFGDTVTVSGLVTGGDIEKQLSDKPLGDKLIIPQNMLREGGEVFLDDVHYKTLETKLKVPLIVCPVDGEEFLQNLLN